MITQQDIYQAAQAAFKQYHPKFPWPKKHGLEDQEDSFKRAFLALCAEINIFHDKEKKAILRSKEEFIDLASRRYSRIMELEDTVSKKNSKIFFLIFLLGAVIGGFLLYINSLTVTPHCVYEKNLTSQEMYFKSGTVGAAFFDDNRDGNADRVLPFCK